MISAKIKIYSIFLLLITFLVACGGRNPNDPGTEYAPQMYVSKAYEPYSQVAGEEGKNKLNPMGLNMRVPPKGTVSRRRFNTNFVQGDSVMVTDIMAYVTQKDSIEWAERNLKAPFMPTDDVLADGKVLYTRYCAPCHGEQGDGKGKVGGMYKGVPNYTADAYKNLNSGHIYHVITHGKGRMWPHASQLNPDERWKVVYHVHTLQGQDVKAMRDGKKKVEKAPADSTATK
jgi:mono/diheme cytochrome c family protein